MTFNTTVVIHVERELQIRKVKSIDFLIDNEKVIEFDAISETLISYDNDRYLIFEHSKFKMIRFEADKKTGAYTVRLGNMQFMKLLFYCSLHMNFDSSLTERSLLDVLAEVVKHLKP